MTSSVCLHELVHCRSGDKGDDSLLAVFPYASEDYSRLITALKGPLVAAHFGVADGDVEVNEAPSLGGFIIVVRGCLAGGVTRSVRVDPHGKTMSNRLLSLRIPWAAAGAQPQ